MRQIQASTQGVRLQSLKLAFCSQTVQHMLGKCRMAGALDGPVFCTLLMGTIVWPIVYSMCCFDITSMHANILHLN